VGSVPRPERWFWTRLRWRLRGALLWPAFFALIVLDGLLLTLLPPYGDDGPGDLLGGMLLAGFANLFVVAVLAPLAARVLRRARPGLPKVIAVDHAGTALLASLTVVLLALGLLHRPAVAGEREDEHAVAAALHAYVNASAPEYARGLAAADRLRVQPELYRACVPGSDPKRPLCLFIETDQRPASVTRDRDRAPNDVYRSWGGFD
jgi:hypothetical protein